MGVRDFKHETSAIRFPYKPKLKHPLNNQVRWWQLEVRRSHELSGAFMLLPIGLKHAY